MLVRRVLVAVLAVLGVAALVVGIGMRTVWLPADRVQATATVEGDAPLLLTGPGLLEARPGPVTVDVTSATDDPVLVAVGREADVEAWVDGAAHTTLTGFSGPETLSSETTEGEAEVPDPAGSDLWVQTETGRGTVTLEYEARDGRYLVLAAADGASPAPGEVTLTWPREVTTPWSWPLVVLGGLLLLAAVVVLVEARRRAGPGGGPTRPGPARSEETS